MHLVQRFYNGAEGIAALFKVFEEIKRRAGRRQRHDIARLREAVGRSTVAEVALRRDQLDEEIKADIEKEAAGWGVDIISVKVRDIVIPTELQHVMSLEAQADRERNARMTVASAEADLAEMLAEAAQVYGDADAALKLRTMLMQYETVRGSGSAVVTVPTAVSDGFAEGVQRQGGGL